VNGLQQWSDEESFICVQANEILHHKLVLNGYLSEFTGRTMEQMTKDTDRDFFMSAQESVEYGLVDAVISKPTLAALTGV
jgi:ATP-dependent Clp protease protease subunit